MLARIRKSLDENEKGFTLIELLVVIIIIGILAAIAIPVFLNQRQKGWDAAVQSDLKNAATAQETFLTENDAYSVQTPVGTDLTALGFNYSADVNYTTAASITATADAANEYCFTAQSASGDWWTYDSAAGGLQTPGTAAAGC